MVAEAVVRGSRLLVSEDKSSILPRPVEQLALGKRADSRTGLDTTHRGDGQRLGARWMYGCGVCMDAWRVFAK